jgi:V-type H+-transporting ATPase S1 subunit
LGEFWFHEGDKEPTNVPVDSITIAEVVDNADANTDEVPHVNVTMTGGSHKLFLSMGASSGSWHVGEIKYNDNSGDERYIASVTIAAPNTYFSFGCSDLKIQSTKRTNTIRLVNFQIQPFFSKTQNETNKFSGYNSDCVGFYSPAIWSALFVVILFLFILSYGLSSIMDIRTMDKFDDPKGKTITVNAQE